MMSAVFVVCVITLLDLTSALNLAPDTKDVRVGSESQSSSLYTPRRFGGNLLHSPVSANLNDDWSRSSLSNRRWSNYRDQYEDRIIHGDSSLHTWSLPSRPNDRYQVNLRTDGCPMNADIEMWEGPDNTPQRMKVFSEDGHLHPVNAGFETGGYQNAITMRNTGPMEFPCFASVDAVDWANRRINERWNSYDRYNGYGGYGGRYRDGYGSYDSYSGRYRDGYGVYGYGGRYIDGHYGSYRDGYRGGSYGRVIQGGAVHTVPFDPSIRDVQVVLTSEGLPIEARIELLQGPSNVKQSLEVYSEDGRAKPFYANIKTASGGSSSSIRIVNTGPIEFPITATLEPY